MSSGAKNRTNKATKGGMNRNVAGGNTENHTKQTKPVQNHNEKIKETPASNKIAPTAEQLRIAQMIDDNTHSDKALQEKMSQVMLVTGVSTDVAVVALHDCNNDVNAAIDALLEGEGQGEWRESTKKKKKAPAIKGKEDIESNKENRKMDTRERGGRSRGGSMGGLSRSRGRGGRGNKEDFDANLRGPSNRRGHMTNGNTPFSRGRGSRGRGSSMSGGRSFQKRNPQPPTFTETIDTWDPPEKVETTDTLQIEYWDDEKSTATTEDWDNEWTGSLDKTTVFSPSTVVSGPPQMPPIPDRGMSTENEVESKMNSVLGQVNNAPPIISSVLSESVNNVLSLGQSQQLNANSSRNDPHSFSSNVPSSVSLSQGHGSISQGQAIDLAALLQKAAPHSTLGRLPPSQMVDSSSISQSSLVSEVKNNLLTGINSSVGDTLGSGLLPVNSASSVSASQPYASSSAAMNSNSMFSNSVADLTSSLSSGNKVLSLSSQNQTLSSRTSKPQRSRLPPSKIPSQAVEMPEVAMAALDMQFTGLEFGTETFDFTSPDVKQPMMSISSSSVSSRDQGPPPPAPSAKDLPLSSSISQSQSLGPQSIPFPSQSNERNSQPNLLSGTSQRPVSATAQSLADLAQKDGPSASGGHSLGSLVGSVSSSHSYQPPPSGYGSKVSSFPSPPTHHFSQNSSQSYVGNTSGVSNNNSYGGNSASSNMAGVPNSSSAPPSNQGPTGYGSSYSSQTSNTPYQNSYVSASSHSLTSMNASKPTPPAPPPSHANLKDSAQSYTDNSNTSSNNLGSSLSSASGGPNSVGGGGLSLNLVSPPTSPIQPVKSTVPGKSVNSFVASVPPGVQRHSGATPQLNQQHQSTNPHFQQLPLAQQQTPHSQPLMAGHSQYVSPAQQAALQGPLPQYFNLQQPMYSFEDLQLFQQRMPHMPQAPTTLPTGRDSSITSPQSYSVTDANKFRTDQSSSPVPSTLSQQGAAQGATYITTPGNAGMPPIYMYQTMPAVPNSFSQYAAPAIIQIPSNTHTGSSSTQFPGPPKIYGGTSAYYDSMSQTQDFKSYGTGSQGQAKAGPNSAGSGTNSASDLSGYKNHLTKVGRSYDKQAYHTATPPPPPFNLAGSGTNPMAANYTPMFIPTLPAGAQHHSTLMHHQLHQDGTNSAGQRPGAGGVQNKGPSKGPYSGSYWAS